METGQESIFSKIYRDHVWGTGGLDSPLSGQGSLPHVAKPYVDFVERIIERYAISSVLDVGHGDWKMWQDYKFENTNYLGIDVAESISESNMVKFGNDRRRFMQVAPSDPLPKADLLLCKDVLQHLSNIDIDNLLSQISKFKYVILCNDVNIDRSLIGKLRLICQPKKRIYNLLNLKYPFYLVTIPRNNLDISTGEYRGLDLESSNFMYRFRNFECLDRFEYNFPHDKHIKATVLFFKNLQN
jgi:hypothetical protein